MKKLSATVFTGFILASSHTVFTADAASLAKRLARGA